MRIKWPAVVLAAIVHFALGAAWFTVFAQPWVAGLRMSAEEVQYLQTHMNPLPYFVAFVCNFVIAFVLAWVLSQRENRSLIAGVSTGFWLGLAAAAALVTELAFERRAPHFVLIAAAYPLVGCILMGIVLGAWRPAARTMSNSTVPSTGVPSA